MNRGYGTAFEKLEDEDGPIKKRPKRVHEEVVTDERGRRRFHGAFTGGFSAGYWNTVGSKHGWVPQTYKSSRNKRAEVGAMRPEDFMDEEDLGEFGIASRQFHVNRRYVDVGETGQAVWDRPSTSIAKVAEVEDDGVRVTGKSEGASVGYQIMKKMGYREGKGVGAPLTRRQLEMQRLHEARAHGKRSRFDKTAVEEAEMFAAGFEFVPEDIPPVYFACKTDTHGLGYTGLSGLSGGYGSLLLEEGTSNKGKKKGHGDAFGVGVFEDSDDDIYDTDDKHMYNFAIEGNRNADVDPMAVVLASGGGGNIDIKFSAAKHIRKRTPHLSIKVPPGFNPNYTPVAFDASALPAVIKNYGSSMTPLQRAMILGDKAPSVMELLSDADRERLRHARRLADEQKAANTVKQEEVEKDEFPDDEEKSYRFKKYIQCLRRGVEMGQPPGVSYSQWQAEEEEFQNRVPTELRYLLPDVKERKQPLFKGDFSANLMDQLKSKFVTQDDAKSFAEKPKPREPFQKLEWHPAKRLCKRLKVPDPFPDSDFEGAVGSKSKNKTSQGVYEFTKTAMEKELIQKNAIENAVGSTQKEVKQEPVDTPLTEEDPLIQFFDLMDKVYGTTTEEIKEGERLEKEFAKPAEPAPMPKQLSPPRPSAPESAPKKKKTIFDDPSDDETKEYGPAVPTNFIPPSKVKNPDLPQDLRPKFESKSIKKEPAVIELSDSSESESSSDESRRSKKKKSKKTKKDKHHKKKDRKERSSSKKSKHKKHSREKESKSSKKSKKHRRHRSSSQSD